MYKLSRTTNAVNYSFFFFTGNPFSAYWFAGLYIMRGWGPFKTVKIQPCHSVLRNRSPIDYRRRERSCSSPEKGVIIIFPISVSIVFLKVRHNKHLWRATQECHQSKVLDDVSFFKGFVWAKPQKWTFIRLGPGSALRVKRRKNSRADRDYLFPHCGARCQDKINKNALNSVESHLLGDKFCCQRRWCYYATLAFWIQNECYVS